MKQTISESEKEIVMELICKEELSINYQLAQCLAGEKLKFPYDFFHNDSTCRTELR